MYTGTLINDLIATVRQAEEHASDRAREQKLEHLYALAQAELANFDQQLAGVA